MNYRISLWGLLCGSLLAGSLLAQDANPHAEGFDLAGSDPQAIVLADAVMKNMGGRTNWNNTHYLRWSLFGRTHLWDKWAGLYRLEQDSTVVILNLKTRQGRMWQNGVEIQDPDVVQKRLERAYGAWVNDSYWFIMPYKLKDSGVTLKYAGEGQMEDGRMSDIIELTFKDTGLTPQNKYLIYIGKENGLVEQWAFFRNATDTEPGFVLPWTDWNRYGNILISSGRGERPRGKVEVTNIAVLESVPDGAFERPDPLSFQ